MQPERNRAVLFAEAGARPTVNSKGEETVTLWATFRADGYSSTEQVHISLSAAATLYFDISEALEFHTGD
ncbi:hypothetical protein ABZ464_02555 [Streptomyces sp. NPDC005820]|uniref:hypothetical protein n=1 Tax=Streptomyces sp. NPDC005820 TaxID=3157069 RepID=UPI0033F540A8